MTDKIVSEIATVPINENVVQVVLQFLAAETLYKKLWVPIGIRAIIACVYQLPITERRTA